ncbi:MAG: hypothetical protein H7145_00605 [Akkermansiaceae bacterium]|nr:hypothetical protein [Armatimonadota bacterium]
MATKLTDKTGAKSSQWRDAMPMWLSVSPLRLSAYLSAVGLGLGWYQTRTPCAASDEVMGYGVLLGLTALVLAVTQRRRAVPGWQNDALIVVASLAAGFNLLMVH